MLPTIKVPTTALLTLNIDTLKQQTSNPSEASKLIANELAIPEGGSNDGLFPYRWIPSALLLLKNHLVKNGYQLTMKIVSIKYERYAQEIEMLHTAEGKRPDSKSNLEVLEKLLTI